MTGNTLTRSVRAVGQMVAHPVHGARWVRWRMAGWSPLERATPWMSWNAIEHLEGAIRPGMRVFEWGGGGSTRFFLRKGCRVTTCESSGEWKEMIERAVGGEARPGQLEIRHVPAETKDPVAVAEYIRSVHGGEPWDVVLVDGLEEGYVSRVSCVKELTGAGVVADGGMIILDDAWRPEYDGVPGILSGWRREVYRGLGPARLGVTQTDVYRRAR